MKYRLNLCDVNIKSNMDALLLNISYKLNLHSHLIIIFRQESKDRLSPLVATYTSRRETEAQDSKR